MIGRRRREGDDLIFDVDQVFGLRYRIDPGLLERQLES
jgi:hypothetical protein